MKNIVKIVALSATLASAIGTAQAQDTATGAVTASATVPNTCYIRSITQAGGSGAVTAGSAGNTSTATLNYANVLADTSTALSATHTQTLTVDAYCNYAGYVKLSSANNGLVVGTNPTTVGTFNKRVNYTATLSGWGTSTPTLTTNGDKTTNTGASVSGTALTPGVPVNTTSATLQIVTTGDSSIPMLAGTYSDVLRVVFQPTA